MEDPRTQKLMNPEDLPGDGHRMFWGGFDVMFRLCWVPISASKTQYPGHMQRELQIHSLNIYPACTGDLHSP